MADPSLLSAGLEAPDAADEALRRLLLQATREEDEEEPPPAGPSRAVTPQPGLCVKTRAGGAKVFLNVCHSREVPPPPPLSPPGLWRLLHGPRPPPGGGFRIPMSLGEPHAELDQGGRGCTAYDVVVNSGFFRTLQADPLYLEFFLTVAMEGLSEKYGVELELTDWRVLQNRKFMGSISAQNIRARPRPHIQELEGPPPEPPKFVVVAEPSAQHPKVLQARVLLPHIEGAVSLQLGLNQERLVLGGAGGGPPLLQLGLPLPPDPPRCRARFHRGTKVLTVTMPLQL
ncbi:LOW QUALITY PROTEIN: PIH1 domain-containing protein 1 [Strigops habroptila]|uniref:LOW QUALITY PROTEIN: PIH1 domain-containing protein 1 n=1 Tax=Strigops habroptila TaxID=2489341 RepID=UPI0011CEE285|nr:LOW QUALITY PROTEIN: PIH1 domain-containing protein 1 [Strigops habroptila]